jgi:hypothetical protein
MVYAKFIVVGFLAALADSPPSQEANEKDTLVSDQRQFRIPYALGKGPKEVREVRLYYSRDMGKSWKLCDQVPARQGDFFFRAPEKGLYWFAVQLLRTDGSLEPKTTAALTPDIKMKLTFDESVPSWDNLDEKILTGLRSLRENWVSAPETQEIFRLLQKNIADLEARKKAAEKAKAAKANSEK